MFHDNQLPPNFSFSGLIRDISEYFKILKNSGVKSPDISLKSEKIIKNLNVINEPASKAELLHRIEHKTLKTLSCLSLYGSGDPCARLFFIISGKKEKISGVKVSDKQREKGKFTEVAHREFSRTELNRSEFFRFGMSRSQRLLPEIYQGEAGKLFLKIIEAMHLSKDAVYTSCIAVPEVQDYPDNRKEIKKEMDLCVGLIKEQIEIIKPEVICCLGDIAARGFLNKNYPVSILRGQFYDYKGIKVMATFDPGLLLYEPAKKRDVWDDMQKIMAILGI